MIRVRFTLAKISQFSVALVLVLAMVAALVPKTAFAAPQNSGCSHYYKVHKGDTLSQIAARYGVNYHNLARANGIHNPNHIYYGQKLCITGGGYGGYNHGYGYQSHTKYYPKQHGYGHNYGRSYGHGYHKPSYPKHHYHRSQYGHHGHGYNR